MKYFEIICYNYYYRKWSTTIISFFPCFL